MNVIRQTVRFNASGETLFDIYIDPKRHAAFTGAPVTIGRKPGSKFKAFGGALTGHTLCVVPKRLIVMSWRSTHFHKSDPDSLLMLAFGGKGRRGRIELLHVGVPDQDLLGVQRGWPKFYWRPLRTMLARKTPRTKRAR